MLGGSKGQNGLCITWETKILSFSMHVPRKDSEETESIPLCN